MHDVATPAALLPVVAIVGRPNVGKSTLFNCLTRSREALVADEPGLTRDRKVGLARAGGRRFVVVDTGGLAPPEGGGPETAVARLVSEQALRAAGEADVVVLVVDARAGLTAQDEAIAERVRGLGRALVLAVNKAEGLDPALATAEFHRLGIEPVLAVSAAHHQGIRPLAERVLARAGADRTTPPVPAREALAGAGEGTRIAVVGRPNVGKSTLVNRLAGEERVIAHDLPGTTRDSVEVPFEHRGRPYVLIDTAGLRRRARVSAHVEKLGAVRALQAIEAADVAIVVLDATEGITDQDLAVIGQVLEAGRALALAVNKWDAVDPARVPAIRAGISRRLRFLDYVRPCYVSARRGTGLGPLLDAARRAAASARRDLPTPDLTRLLAEALARHPPPLVRGRRIRLRYAHQGGVSPPVIVVHGNQTEALPGAYLRYLEGFFRHALDLEGTPVVVRPRTGENPYRGRRNPLTPRQARRRKRLIRHRRR